MSITPNIKDCLIIGRSPFINEVDWKRIDWDRFFVICVNYPVPDIPVDIVVARDDAPNPVLAPDTKFISPRTGYRFVEQANDEKEVEFCCYTSSSAVYLAYKLGFKKAYLIGIDHIEDGKPFVHYDGIVNQGVASVYANQYCKRYIYSLKKYLTIYQTNPTVKGQWDLEFADIQTLFTL